MPFCIQQKYIKHTIWASYARYVNHNYMLIPIKMHNRFRNGWHNLTNLLLLQCTSSIMHKSHYAMILFFAWMAFLSYLRSVIEHEFWKVMLASFLFLVHNIIPSFIKMMRQKLECKIQNIIRKIFLFVKRKYCVQKIGSQRYGCNLTHTWAK